MSNSDTFVHLHVHTEFSLLDGLSRIKKLVSRAKELDMPALAITDHGVMFGVMDFYKACRKEGVKPIIGMEAYLAPRGMEDRDPKLDRTPFHMLLLAENQTGYRNLMKISSEGQIRGYYYRPRVDWEFLAAHSEGLIATTGCLAAKVPRYVQDGNDDEAREWIGRFSELFGPDRFYLELQEHDIDLQRALNRWLIDYNKTNHTNVGLLATSDLHYVDEGDFDIHDTQLCIQTGSLKNDENRLKFSDNSFFMYSTEQMKQMYKAVPEAVTNSVKIAEMCDVDLDRKGYHLPVFPVPEGYDARGYLRRLCDKGLAWRYGDAAARDPVLQERLERELTIIDDMGFNTYFLIVWDLCEYARHADIWWNVRGSGAGSLAAYCLGITNIDPIQNNLLFERFLNPGRVSMPDIDLDYPDDRRGEMISYAARKYGEDKVAAIITFGTLGAKAAVRDVGRALDVPLADVNRAAALIPQEPRPKPLGEYVDNIPDLRQVYESDRTIRSVIDAAKELQGISRHASTHAAGVIIADQPLVEYLPLHRITGKDPSGGALKAVTQFPMETCEEIGLLKVDFLGLSTLTILRKACDLIERYHGIKYTMDNIPYRHEDPRLDDAGRKQLDKAFAMMGRGETVGVFQVESSGMQQMLRGMKPKVFENIIAAVSLYRPGPMDFIPQYNRRLHDEEVTEFRHPKLAPILGETYGICISGDSLVIDAETGERVRVDSLAERARDFTIQGVDEHNQTAVARVTHWIDNGVKPVFRLTLKNGASIKATADHRFLTESGWVELQDLRAGDYVAAPPKLVEPAAPRTVPRDKLRVLADGSEKSIPGFVFQLNDDDLAFFLAALWDCDGYMGRKICHFKTISAQLARDVQTLLLRLGIPSVIHANPYTNAVRDDRVSYQVTVYETARFAELVQPHMVSDKRDVACIGQGGHNMLDRERFIAELDGTVTLSRRALMAQYGIDRQHFMRQSRQRRARISAQVVQPISQTLELVDTQRNLNVAWHEIASIEPAGVERVYDLTVEGIHNFVANNIIVHNCVYQEQIMQIAGELFGYELGEADLMRRAVSKKKAEALAEHRAIFLERGPQNGIDEDAAGKIFDDIEFFANYGFNKSHAADYAVITVQTAYLKAHFAAEYMTALLSVHRDDQVKITVFLEECRRLEIPVLPPDINHSMQDFDIQVQPDGARGIRFGLAAIKNASAGVLDVIISEREENGPFADLDDFCQRVDLRTIGKRTVESLIKVGALAAFGERGRLLNGLERIMGFSANYHKDKEIGQMTLFGESTGMAEALYDTLPSGAEYLPREMLGWEKELLGLYVTGRPVDKFRDDLKQTATAVVQHLKQEPGLYNGKQVSIAGEIVSLRKIYTRNNDAMGVAQIEDWHESAASIEVVLFPRTWNTVMAHVESEELRGFEEGEVVMIGGKFDTSRGDAQIIAETVTQNFNLMQAEGATPDYNDDMPVWVLQEMDGMPPPPPDYGNVIEDDDYDEETGEVVATVPEPETEPAPVVAPASHGAAGSPSPSVEPQFVSPADPIPDSEIPAWAQGIDETLPVDLPMPDEGPQRWLIIYFRRSGDDNNDRRRLRRVHGVLTEYPGSDRFSIVIEGPDRNETFEFPNHSTGYCEELLRDLVSLVGDEKNIEVYEPPTDIF